MSPETRRLSATVATADDSKSMGRRRLPAAALLTLSAIAVLGGFPVAASAHGPVAPIASSYKAKVGQVPAGLDAKVVDGDQRMWLKVARGQSVVVLDYRGAPYLRFSRSGVDVNHNSSIYYLNQTPVAEVPPANLTRSTPPSWHRVTGSDSYGWHDGRLHALATVARAPGRQYVGKWSIPVTVNGRSSSISGGLWHADDPSIAWFWPIVVVLAWVLAALRVRRAQLDELVARVLAFAALAGVTVGGIARQLHGRPSVGTFQVIGLVLILAFVAWALSRLLFRSPGYFYFLVVAVSALWQGAELFPTLRDGFVLAAVPAFVARVAAVVCLATGAGLLVLVFRLSQKPGEARSADTEWTEDRELEDDAAWELER
jgi:hypothetical protein